MPLVSVILPSRGRPDSLLRAVASLAHGDCEIIVGLDDDGGEDIESLVPELERLGNVTVIVAPRAPCIGKLLDNLGKHATGDFLLPFTDDYTIDSEDWVERVRVAVERMPHRMGVAYLRDPMYPNFATFPIVSRETIALCGFFMPPFFPFLFGDTWWNEVGGMSGLIYPCTASVSIMQETGHIHNFRDLRLWTGVFNRTRPMRELLAIQMIRTAMPGNEQGQNSLIATVPDRAAICAELLRQFNDKAFVDKWESWGDGFPHPHYSAMKAKAEAFMEATA